MYREAHGNDVGGALLTNTTLATFVKNESDGISARINGRARIFTVCNAANLYLHIDTHEKRLYCIKHCGTAVLPLWGPRERRSPDSPLRLGTDPHYSRCPQISFDFCQ